jgi:alkylhydroperoxidase family enzyme
MTWLAARAPGATPLEEVIGLRPELAPLLDEFLVEAWSAGDPVVLELCRLRIATLHGDVAQQQLRHQSAIDAGLTEEQVVALPDHHRSELFSDHQRACVRYAEQFVVDVHGLTDDDAAAVKHEMTDAEFVAFTVALGLFDGIGRLRLTLGIEEPATAGPRLIPTPSADHPAH